MFGFEFLEVVIGIVFVYLLLSLICSVLSEWFARILAMRSNTLEAGIRNLLNDPDGKGLAEKFYNHPLVKGLTRQGWFDKLQNRNGRPSYIPSRTFALALMDIVAPPSATLGSKVFQDVRDMVVNLPDTEIKNTLLVLIDEAGDDLKKVRENVENWFNDAMDRVSGWYKRKVQLFILCLAFIVSVGSNTDTLMIANNLWRDTTMRASIVAAAQEAVKQPPPTGTEPSLTRIKQFKEEFQQLQLPIGWSPEPGAPGKVPGSAWGWFMKIVGLLLTTIAVSQGAPFWFDALNKLVSLRLTGKQPEKTPTVPVP